MRKSAKWITSPQNLYPAAVTFKKSFALEKPVKKATLKASSIGVYAAYINGERVGRNVLAPGWTAYDHRVLYQTYDVTSMLKAKNKLEIGAGQGWAGRHYDGKAVNPMIIAWLNVTFADGTSERIITDTDWEVYTSETTQTALYHGETIDKTAKIKLIGNAVISKPKAKLEPQDGEDIVEVERIAPVELIRTPKGEIVIDFGQNMTGYVEVRIKGKRGGKIVMHHAEVLDRDGNFYTDNYRRAKNENIYVLSGKEDVFKPVYTFQGFRYIRLTEYPLDTVDLSCFRAIAVHSDIRRTGYFRSGNDKINQLYHNVIWGQKSNYLDLPTDCPQRDERLGWTGDAQVFCRTGAINYDVEKFFKKWLRDLRLEQQPSGIVNIIVPRTWESHPSAAWSDAICIIPWELYLAYGNPDILKDNFDSMKKWVDYVRGYGPEEYLWLGELHFGDWLAMDSVGDSLNGGTSHDLIASAYFAKSTENLVLAGETLGEDMSEYKKLYKNIVKKFRSYFMENGMPKETLPMTGHLYNTSEKCCDPCRGLTQTALTLILRFGLCTDRERPSLANKLAELIHENGDRMCTGFVGTPHLLHALSENGYADLAYTLLTQEKNPSWLFSVNRGATTMWEHWDSIKEDGSFWSDSMNSFNHYAYGAVYDWIFGVAVGIKTVAEAPAYKKVKLTPHPSKLLGSAEASIDSRNGLIRSNWYYKGDVVYYEFDVPEGVTAHLTLPSGHTEILTGGTYHFAE